MFGLVGDLVEGAVGGVSWPIGLAVAAVAIVGGPRAKPLAKRAIKGYLNASHRAREWVAETGEQIQDLYAEARHEYEVELAVEDVAEPEPPPRSRPRRARAAPAIVPTEQPA